MPSSVRTVLCMATLAAAVLAVAAGVPARAHAWSRACNWPTGGSGTTTVPVYLNCDSFAEFGFACNDVINIVQRGIDPWNNVAGTALRFAYMGTTTSRVGTAGQVTIMMNGMHSAAGPPAWGDPSRSASAFDYCNAATIVIHGDWYHNTRGGDGGPSYNLMLMSMLHELGHTTGLNHANDPPGCASGTTNGASVMLGNPNDVIYSDDYAGMLGTVPGTCGYAPRLPSGGVRVKAASDHATWVTQTSCLGSTNLTPAIAVGGAPGGPGNGYMLQAATDVNGYVQVYRYSSSTGCTLVYSSVFVKAIAGPRLAAYPGGFILAYPQLVANNDGKAQIFFFNSDASTYYQANVPSWATYHSIGIAWSSYNSKVYLAFSKPPQNGNEGTLFVSMSSDLFNFDAGTSLNTYTETGPGIVCPGSPASSLCWVATGDARVSGQTIRETLFGWDTNGVPSFTAQSFRFPISNGRWITTRYDVSAAWEPAGGGYVAYGFREADGAKSADIAWIDDLNSYPPPGFSTTVGSPPAGFTWLATPTSGSAGGENIAYDQAVGAMFAIAEGP